MPGPRPRVTEGRMAGPDDDEDDPLPAGFGPTDSRVFNVDEALSHVRILRERLRENREKLKRARASNRALASENRRLESEADTLVVQNARLAKKPKANKAMRLASAARVAPSGFEDDAVDDDEDLDVPQLQDARKAAAWYTSAAQLFRRLRGAVSRAVETTVYKYLPLQRDVQKITSRHGEGLAAYFAFCAWLLLNQLAQLLVFLPVLVVHAVAVATGSATPDEEEAPLISTWPLHYSSFRPSDGGLYTLCLVVSIASYVVSTAMRYIRERRAAQYVEVRGLGGERMRFARTVLNSVDFTAVDSAPRLADAQATVGDRLRLLVDEDERMARIEARTARERAALRARRLVGILVFVVLQASSWAVIVTMSLNARSVSAALESRAEGLALLADFAVPVVVAVINAVLPLLNTIITNFERWDHPTTRLQMMMSRLFSQRILNLLITVSGYGLLVAFQDADPAGSVTLALPGGAIVVNLVEPDKARFGCVENQVGISLWLFVAVEFAVDKIASVGKVVWAKRQGRMDEFALHTKVISLVYFHSLLLLAAPYSPWITIVAPGLLLIDFKFDVFLLRRFMARPADPWPAAEVGSYFFRLYFITFGIALCWDFLFLRGEGVHACGPHREDLTAWASMEKHIAANPVLSTVYAVVLNALLLWVLLAVLYVRASTQASHRTVLERYAEDRISQLLQQHDILEAKARVQERRLRAAQAGRGPPAVPRDAR